MRKQGCLADRDIFSLKFTFGHLNWLTSYILIEPRIITCLSKFNIIKTLPSLCSRMLIMVILGEKRTLGQDPSVLTTVFICISKHSLKFSYVFSTK